MQLGRHQYGPGGSSQPILRASIERRDRVREPYLCEQVRQAAALTCGWAPRTQRHECSNNASVRALRQDTK